MKIVFTGTQKGMSIKQHKKINHFISTNNIIELRHGDCKGSDNQIHDKLNGKVKIIIHPPLKISKRAFCKPIIGKILPPDNYIPRNHNMIDTKPDLLLATPNEKEEILRSGTWATIRYAKKCKITVIIIHIDGTIKIWNKNEI